MSLRRFLNKAMASRLERDLTPVGSHPGLRENVQAILENALQEADDEIARWRELNLAPWDPKANPNPKLPS